MKGKMKQLRDNERGKIRNSCKIKRTKQIHRRQLPDTQMGRPKGVG